MPELYVKYDGDRPVAYAYGEEWVAQALFMDDIGYPDPETAKAAWWMGLFTRRRNEYGSKTSEAAQGH